MLFGPRGAIEYLYKYMHKGADTVLRNDGVLQARITEGPQQEAQLSSGRITRSTAAVTTTIPSESIDNIDNFKKGRLMTGTQGCYQILVEMVI